MLPQDVAKTKKIAAVRIHGERKMHRMKNFDLVCRQIDAKLFDILELLILYLCCFENWQAPLTA